MNYMKVIVVQIKGKERQQDPFMPGPKKVMDAQVYIIGNPI